MLFELRTGVPDVSKAWLEARDEFLAGRTRRAWELAQSLRKSSAVACANDYVLNIEIARACSAHRTYFALTRRALSAYGGDPIVRLYYARMLRSRNRHIASIEFLQGCRETLGKSHPALWGTALADAYASARFGPSCQRVLDEIEGLDGMDSPAALYQRSCSYEATRQWDRAIDVALRCVKQAPHWARARGYLANCLFARGRVEDAMEHLRAVESAGLQDATVDVTLAYATLQLGHLDEARSRFEALLADWPQADFRQAARRSLCILLVELGENEAARRVAAGDEARLALPEIPQESVGRHCLIPLPLIGQNQNQCVPTAVAMAAWPQGRRLDPNAMFQEMQGREGTALWRMRQWVEDHGFRLVPIRLEKDAIVEMLDRGIPLIGVLEDAFNSHVEVVCGYRDDLNVFYVRDPMHWVTSAHPCEAAFARYDMDGGLLAVIEAAREDDIAAAQQWYCDEASALMDLLQAESTCDLEAAERAYERIADDSPAAMLRDSYAMNILISPERCIERMEAIACDAGRNPVARFRAFMHLTPEGAEKLLAEPTFDDMRENFGVGVKRFLLLRKLIDEGQWSAASEWIDRLLLTGGSVSVFWERKSDVLAELGQHDASREALDRAIELEPFRMSLREKQLQRNAVRLTYAEYLDEYNALLEQALDEKGLLFGRAAALYEGPDGRAYEEAAREAIRWFPRLPLAYANLLSWYRMQQREDLAQRLLVDAKRMLPGVFDAAPPSALASSVSDGELPEDKEELLEYIWNPDAALRREAISKLLDDERSGQLSWQQRANFLSCRLLISDDGPQGTVDATAVLPDEVSGPAIWFTRSVCEILTQRQPTPKVALTVNAWLDRAVGEVEAFPDLWLQRVLLYEYGLQMERALEELRRLLDRYPAYSAALYRMGVVKAGRNELKAAKECFEQALQVHPGLPGAMDMLRQVNQALGDHQGTLECIRMLRRCMPYAISYLRMEVQALAEAGSADMALTVLDAAAGDFPAVVVQLLRARIWLTVGQFDAAVGELSGVSVGDDADDATFEEYLDLKLSVAAQRGEDDEVLRLCQWGLQRWPDSTRLQEMMSERLARSDPKRSLDLLREVLQRGQPQPQTAMQYLGLVNRKVDRAARDLVLASPPDRQQYLAELFASAMEQPGWRARYRPYLEWARKQFPESDQVRWYLAMHYNTLGKTRKAIRIATELYERNPNHAEAARLLGQCWLEKNAVQAKTYLQQACRLNRSIDNLFELARCNQGLQDLETASRLYWEILEQNPYMSPAWVNLYLMNTKPTELWRPLVNMLEANQGGHALYFSVAAVYVALRCHQFLPPNWYPMALQRWAVVRNEDGFLDERKRLLLALLAWQQKRPRDTQGRTDAPRHLLEWITARYWWPRHRWIPPEDLAGPSG